jgi:hypothetical protein
MDDNLEGTEVPSTPPPESKPTLRKWTQEELAFLKKYFPKKGRGYVAERLQRSRTGVAARARMMGLHREELHYWSTYEDNYLRRNFGKKTAQSIGRTLHRTTDAVQLRAARLGLGKRRNPTYTAEERALIKQQYAEGVSATKIAEQMGRPVTSIRTRLNRWGYKSGRVWTKREENYLRKHYLDMMVSEMAKKLGRTTSAVQHYLKRHGMKKKGATEKQEQPAPPSV